MADLKKGIIHAFVTGSHGRPQVMLEALAYWREPEGKEWTMSIASLLPTRVIQRPGAGIFALDGIAGFAMQAKSGDPDLHTCLVVESTASPGVPDAARSRHKDAWGYVRDVRLIAGGEPDTWAGATIKVGAGRLTGNFHECIETRGAGYLVTSRGVPVAADCRLVAISFGRYAEAEDVLPLAQVKAALASATDIRSAGKPGEEVLLSTPAEAIGAALMLALWMGQVNPPASEPKLGERRTLSRSVGGIA